MEEIQGGHCPCSKIQGGQPTTLPRPCSAPGFAALSVAFGTLPVGFVSLPVGFVALPAGFVALPVGRVALF